MVFLQLLPFVAAGGVRVEGRVIGQSQPGQRVGPALAG